MNVLDFVKTERTTWTPLVIRAMYIWSSHVWKILAGGGSGGRRACYSLYLV